MTGSGGMLLGIVRAAGELSPLGLSPDQRVATLVSLTLTPLRITDGLRRWDGRGEQVPCEGTAVLFGRSIAAVLPEADGGTVAFFSMATSFTAAALGAEGLATDVELLIGNGYAPGHAALAMELVRTHQGVRALIEDTEICSQGRHVNTAHP